MKERKPRTKEQNPFFEGKKCWYFDGWRFNSEGEKVAITECMVPWSDRCTSSQHDCKHLKMQYLASLSEKERKRYLERNG